MALTLDPCSLISPVLLGEALSVDLDLLPLVVNADTDAVAVDFTLVETGQLLEVLSYAAIPGKRQFTADVNIPVELGVYHITIRAKNTAGSGYTQVSPNLTLTVIRATNVDVVQALPPTGVAVQRLMNLVRVKWQKPELDGFLGVRVRQSTDITGINVPYTQWGNLITASAATQRDTLTTTSTLVPSLDGLHKITTMDEALVNVPYSQVDFFKTQVSVDKFYVMLTSVVQDPDTHHIHESYGIGPFECAFVDLRRVLVTDFPPGFTPEDIAIQLIANIAQAYPNVDLTPRSEMRDVYVDPVALELANASTRTWFANVSNCVDALAQIDDADGDGVADDPALSTFKQALAKAFRLSDAQVQVLIDNQFDILGSKAGVPRFGLQAATVDVTFYLLSKPTKRYTIAVGALVNTLPDGTTPSLSFKTLGSAVMDPASADSYYDAAKGWWAVTVPCICTTSGDISNVGSGTIRTVIAGTNYPMLCTNQDAADYGLDTESNSSYASRIVDRLVVGVDTGRRLGYQAEARKAFGVIDAQVVSSGDLEMLRDWDPVRQKHVFGTVDIYTRGRSVSQEVLNLPYLCATEETFGDRRTYHEMRVVDAARLQFGFSGNIPDDPCAALVELIAARTGVSTLDFNFGVGGAIYDPSTQTFFLDPNELTFKRTGDTITFGSKNSVLISTVGATTLLAMVKLWSALKMTPLNQPVTQVYSVVGEDGLTGALPSNLVRLVKSDDPMLEGGSYKAQDRISVDNATVSVVRTLRFTSTGPDTLDLGEGIMLPLGLDGKPTAFPAVRSEDAMTLYTYGKDYLPVALGQHGHFGIKRLATGLIPLEVNFLLTLDLYRFREKLTLRTDTVSVSGSVATPLPNPGFVQNVWTPESHKLTDLLEDVALVDVARPLRYIKVTYDKGSGPLVMQEGKDFSLSVDAATGQAQITRYISGGTVTSQIDDGASIVVSYYTAEMFRVTTRYPQFIQQITQNLDSFRHAAADVLVKAMTENHVDMDFTVDVASGVAPEIVDRKIRTVITAAHDNATAKLTQAEIVRQIKALPGVKNVRVPFRRMTKSDGSYDIGLIIPTGTLWTPMSTLVETDADFSALAWNPRVFITKDPVLRYKTLPSGGLKDSYVGLLHEGEAFTRALSLPACAAASDSTFYIVGVNDRLSPTVPVDATHYGKVILVVPMPTATREAILDPGQLAFRLTYQVFGEAGAHDIPIGPTEYLKPGKVTVDYVVEDKLR